MPSPRYCIASRIDPSAPGASPWSATPVGAFPVTGEPPDQAPDTAEAQEKPPAIMTLPRRPPELHDDLGKLPLKLRFVLDSSPLRSVHRRVAPPLRRQAHATRQWRLLCPISQRRRSQ
jgi:hypothetical protein